MRIAVIPVGYADGLNRHLGNERFSVYVKGKLCRILGNICMDMCMIDVSDVEVGVGDRVEIFGENNPVQTIADVLETIPYEIFTSVSQRIKRIYYRE
jgi:alanine racemase